MLLRFALSAVFVIVLARPSAADQKFRVVTEDAFASQCRAGVCATVQVTRSTFSDGGTETILLLSAQDASGNSLITGSPFTLIDSTAFVVNKQGTVATLKHDSVDVTWRSNGEYLEVSDFTTRVRDTRGLAFTPGSYRLTEKARQRGADAEGTITNVAEDVADALSIDTAGIPPAEGFGTAFITVRRTTRIEKDKAPVAE